jgi:hypothetical protein
MERGGIDGCDPATKTPSSDHRYHRSCPLESEAVLLTGVNICAHLRSQLNDPIPVDDNEDTLPQLLSKPIPDFSVKLGKRTQKLSEVFPCVPENHLHIIVKLPGKQIDGHLYMGD